MKLSKYFLPVLKEVPAEANIISHQLMLRCGMIKQTTAGIYSWLPLGFKVLKKIEEIEGFYENVKVDFKPQVNFFNLGPENDYKNLLDEKISKEIEKIFYSEMKELGYI